MNTTNCLKVTPVLAALLLGACATDPGLTEQNFGESVRQMIRAQTYDPSTLSSPSDEAVEGTDGQMLEGTLEAYRETVSNPDAVGRDITISVGGSE